MGICRRVMNYRDRGDGWRGARQEVEVETVIVFKIVYLFEEDAVVVEI